MEIWDAYKKNGDKAGCDLYRDKPIPDGLYHIVSEVLVKHTDGSYLLMQRDWNKAGYPGLFEAGASGSVLKGETAYQGAKRELKEETGIYSDDLSLIFAQSNRQNTFYFGFFCTTDCLKDSIVLQKGETISYRWLSNIEFLDFINKDEFIPMQRDRWFPFLEKI
ncbi:MAG: NUDIX domain-containing protein [Oscillospiraceae bacterium]